MNLNIRRVLLLVIAALAVGLLSGCLSMEQRLRGRWVAEGMMGMGGDLEFRSDGTFTWDMMIATQEGTWRVQKKTLLMKMTSYAFDKEELKQMGMEQEASELPTDLMQNLKGMPVPEMAYEFKLKGKELQLTMAGVTLHFTKQY